MRTTVTKPLAVVILSWLCVFLFAAYGAVGPLHPPDTPAYLSWQFFLSTVAGPLSEFFAWPNPSKSDLVFSVLVTLALIASTAWLFRKPSKLSAAVFVALTAFWLLLGLGITYAWV
jgi:hypothetical protein